MFNLIKLAKWHCWTHLLFNFAFMWDNAKLAGHNQGLKKSISMFTFLTCLSNHLIPSTFSVARRVESSEDFSVAYFIPSIPISRKQWLREWLTQTKVMLCSFLRDFSKLRISIELISSTFIILETNQRNRRQRLRGKVSWRWLKLRWSCTSCSFPQQIASALVIECILRDNFVLSLIAPLLALYISSVSCLKHFYLLWLDSKSVASLSL